MPSEAIATRGTVDLEEKIKTDKDFAAWFVAADRPFLQSLAPYIRESNLSVLEFVQAELAKPPSGRATQVPQDALERIEDAETKELERKKQAAHERRLERALQPKLKTVGGLPLKRFYMSRRRILRNGYLDLAGFLNEVQCDIEQQYKGVEAEVHLSALLRIGGSNLNVVAVFQIDVQNEQILTATDQEAIGR